MGKNVAVFVDVANIFYAAKAAGVDIDYVTLLKSASAGRDLVRAYAYTGLDPDNENQRNFHEFLRRHGYKVVSKDIRKYGDGKVKANLDIELVVDMMKTARNLDIAIVISGDGDFAPAIRAVQEMGVRVEVISFRGNTSSDLIEVADQFTEISQIARVEKGSSRSGRRVAAEDDEDLSMTEVPDKQSEGTGARGRARGRGRARPVEAEPVVAAPRSRSRARVAVPSDAAGPVAAVAAGVGLVALPGEKLSRVAAIAPVAPVGAPAPDDEAPQDDDLDGVDVAGDGSEAGDEPRRRRRRRGGRGRGRGRSEGGLAVGDGDGPIDEATDGLVADAGAEDEEEAPAPRQAPQKRAAHTFGSVWDSQIGMPAPGAPAAATGTGPILDDEDLDEPPIPEYLIAERRQQSGGRGGPVRGARAGYSSAVDRERFGGGRGSPVSRFAEPAPRGGRGGDRPRDDRPRDDRPRDDRPRDDRPRPDRGVPRPPRIGSSDEPWSEVPPELEAMLRAQMGSRAARPARPAEGQVAIAAAPLSESPAPSDAPPATRAPRGRGARTATPSVEAVAPAAGVADPETPAPKRRATRTVARAAEAVPAEPVAEAAAPRRRAARPSKAEAAVPAEASAPEAAAPKRRATRKKADAADA